MVFNIGHVVQPTNIQPVLSSNMETNNKAGFSTILKDAISEVNKDQIKADKQTEMLAMGKDIDLHEVMITAQKASITLETTVQVQKKMLDAYKEVMRMQI